jgi:hypothetical protein
MYQIGDAFTTLTPGLNLTAQDFDPVLGEVSVLGDPPARFAAVHCSSLLNAWYRRLQACQADPVQIEQRKGHRRVQVMGCYVYDFSAEGRLKVYQWHVDAQANWTKLLPLASRTADLQGVPVGDGWLDRYKSHAINALQGRHPGQAKLCEAYGKWAAKRFAALCWSPEVQDRVRYQVAIGLDLDVWAVGIAQQIQMSSLPEPRLLVHLYNHVIRRRGHFETLQKDAPQLTTLYSLLAIEVGDPNDAHQVTQLMRTYLRFYGVTPATWRLLCRVGTDWMKPFQAYYDFGNEVSNYIAHDLLRLTQAFGTERLVPAPLLHALMQLAGNPNDTRGDYSGRLNDLFSLCKRLGHLISTLDEDGMALLQDRAHDLFNWASAHLRHLPEGYLRHASLRGLLHRVDRQNQEDAMRQQAAAGWKSPYQLALQTDGVTAVVLDSPLAIWQEGQQMRHCADKWIGPCAVGQCVMVSLRRADKHRPIATVTFDVRRSQVKLHKIAGFANTLASPEIHDWAQQCRRQLQAQRRLMRQQAAHDQTQIEIAAEIKVGAEVEAGAVGEAA